MANEAGGQGSGAGAAPAPGQGGGQGTPSGAPASGGGAGGAPGAGGGQPATAGSGSVPPSGVISLDVLPEGLRNLPETQIRQSINLMVQSLQAANQKATTLERQLQERSRPPAPAASAKREDPTPPSGPPAGKQFADWLLEEPEAALDHYFQRKGQPVVAGVEHLQTRLGDVELNVIRGQVDDFAEHEAEVLELLDASGSPRTREAILGAYTMVVGQKTLAQRQQDRRRALNPETPAPDGGDPPATQYQKTGLTEEIRIGLGLSEEEYYSKYSKPETAQIRVPT